MQSIRIILVMILSQMWSQVLFGQEQIKPDIQFVTLSDTFLIRTIKSIIREEERKDSLFSMGYGYLLLSYSNEIKEGNYLLNNERVDTVFTYEISVSFMHPEEEENGLGNMYPLFFTLVNDRLICIGDSGLGGHYFGFSNKSKFIYNRIIQKYIEPPGSASRKVIKLEYIYIYYLQNRFTGEFLKPVIQKR